MSGTCVPKRAAFTIFDEGRGNLVGASGIAFDIVATSDEIEIETVELLGMKQVWVNDSMAKKISIWASNKTVETADDPADWTMVSDTELVGNPHDDGAGIVPAYQFQPVKISPQSTKGLYFLMQGPLLPTTTNVMIQNGNKAAIGTDIHVCAGYPVVQSADAILPPHLNGTFSPLIAGRIYYKANRCADMAVTTTKVQFTLLLDQNNLRHDDFENIKVVTADAVGAVLASDEQLKLFVNQDGLQLKVDEIAAQLRSYSGECPTNWFTCRALLTVVPFEHSDRRSSGDVQGRLYQHYLDLSQKQLAALKDGAQGAYIGLINAEAKFELKLKSATATALDTAQADFLSKQFVDFVNTKLPLERAQVFNLSTEEQELFSDDAELEIRGTISGAIVAIETDSDFANRIQNIFNGVRHFRDDFIAALKFNVNYPGPMAVNSRHEPFVGLLNFTLDTTAECSDIPSMAPSGRANETSATIMPSSAGTAVPTSPSEHSNATAPPSQAPAQNMTEAPVLSADAEATISLKSTENATDNPPISPASLMPSSVVPTNVPGDNSSLEFGTSAQASNANVTDPEESQHLYLVIALPFLVVTGTLFWWFRRSRRQQRE